MQADSPTQFAVLHVASFKFYWILFFVHQLTIISMNDQRSKQHGCLGDPWQFNREKRVKTSEKRFTDHLWRYRKYCVVTRLFLVLTETNIRPIYYKKYRIKWFLPCSDRGASDQIWLVEHTSLINCLSSLLSIVIVHLSLFVKPLITNHIQHKEPPLLPIRYNRK